MQVLLAITTQLILQRDALLSQNIMDAAYSEDNHLPGAWCAIIPRIASSYVKFPTVAAGDLTSTQQHRPTTFMDHLVYEQRDYLITIVTFCNKKKVLVSNAKIIVPPSQVNIAHLQQNDLVISQS